MERNSGSYGWVYMVVLVLALAVFFLGVYLAAIGKGWEMLATGCLSVIALLLVWGHSLGEQAGRARHFRRQEALFAPLADRLQNLSGVLNLISEQQLISERAKAIAFRESEREAMRRAIRDDIAKQDWEAALTLVADMERVFGYQQEAETFRQEINSFRQEENRRVIGEAAAAIERLCRDEEWNQAWREADELGRRFPDDDEVKRLPQDIEERRQTHKRRLLESWQNAVSRHDVDGSIEILKELDAYLTPSEAESIQETARRIFKDKLQLLGQQFTIALKDRQWAEAMAVGETIMRDFPNSRIAQEVREKMDLLRQAATEVAEAQA